MQKSKITKVVTSCRSRFTIFDQARELNRHGLLHKLITDYPRSYPERFGVPQDKVEPLLFTGIFNHGFTRFRRYCSQAVILFIDRFIHDSFSKKLIKYIPKDTEFFIGMSSFSLEALEYCKKKGIKCAVDHASVHQLQERLLLQEESKIWGLPFSKTTTPDWVIEKEDKEFAVADYVFIPSSSVKASLIKQGVPENKIFINPYGVDVSAFKPAVKKDDVFRVMQVGNITLGKGVLTLIEAFKLANIQNSELVFIGPGLETFGLKEKIDQLKTENIKFLGAVPQAELYKHFAQASVSCLASLADGFALVVIQAMACAKPVIVTENVGSKDLINHGHNGFIVPIRSPQDIAKHLQFLATHPEKLKDMSEKALETASNSCSWQLYGDRLSHFIYSLENNV